MTVPTLPEVMHAARFYAPGDVRYEEVPFPVPGAHEVTVRIETALTCGTDLKAYRRGHPVLLKSLPSAFGHEGAGVVVAIGEQVRQFHVGDRVVMANSAPCGECFFCQKGRQNLCESLDLLNGTYAEYLRIPQRIVEKNTLVLPETVSFEAAAFTEPLAVCVRGIELCHIQPGDHVLVLGLGAIGQFMIRLAKMKGATVVGVGRNLLKRQLALHFAQADVVLDMSEGLDVQKLCTEFSPDGHGFDVVIEAVGLPAMWENALALARRGGLINLFGGCPSGTSISLETRRLHYDELTIVSAFHHTPAHFRKAFELIRTGQLDPTPLITHHLFMSQVTQALEKVSAGHALKVALTP